MPHYMEKSIYLFSLFYNNYSTVYLLLKKLHFHVKLCIFYKSGKERTFKLKRMTILNVFTW